MDFSEFNVNSPIPVEYSPKSPLIINTYISSLVDEDKSYLLHTGIPLESPEATYFYYPELLKSFNSQTFQSLIERWLILIDPYNYRVNYQDKFIYTSYLVGNLLFASMKRLKSLKYFKLNSHDRVFFIKHKEFVYSISRLINLEVTHFVGGRYPSIQSDEDNLNDLFIALSRYTSSIRFVKINISSNNIISFTTRFIKNISDFIAHQFKIEGLSFNESLITENLFEFGEIIKSQETNLKYLTIEGKLKNFASIIKQLRNCTNLESLIFERKEGEEYMMDVNWGSCDIKMRGVPIFEKFGFNQLNIKNIYCVEDCVGVDNEYINFAFGLKKILIMTKTNLRTLNLGRINTSIITTLGKNCHNLTHLSCELPIKDFWLFIRLLEVLGELEHLKLKLKLPPMLNDNYIVAFANSLPSSLKKLGLNLCCVEEEFITYFLLKLLENMGYNKLCELYFYNDQMIRNDNLRIILQFALNRIRYYENSDYRNFKFKYVIENFNQDFDQFLIQNGREYIGIIREEVSDFYHPFYESFGFEVC
ncbi:3633_t:CDS:2 [Rhizophagus irregularis]|nr:3633_t:CDS:2 [Rhizophagus irregularis]